MFNLKNFVNRITDNKGAAGGGSEQSSTPTFGDQEEQHSAEGFLCPLCMTAFSSAEVLEEHYQKTHDDSGRPSAPSHSNGDIGDLRQEILDLQSSLAEERSSSEELKREVLKMQADFHSKDDFDNSSMKSQELEGAKSLLMSEVTLLRQQLAVELERVSELKKDKDLLKDKLTNLMSDNNNTKKEVEILKSQLAHRNTVDDAAILKQELVSVQKMMDQMALERESELAQLQIKLSETEEKLKDKDSDFEAKITATTTSYDTEIKTLRANVEKLEDDLKLVQKTAMTMEVGFTDDLNSLKTKLSTVDNAKAATESECAGLQAEVLRLQEQHSQLYSKIEGGDGAQAALDSFRKENETLSQNLNTSQTQNKELSKNLYNLKLELEKIKEECASVTELYRTGKNEWAVADCRYKDQLKEKDDAISQRNEKMEVLKKSVDCKDSELKTLQVEYDEAKGTLEKQEETLKALSSVEKALRKTVTELQAQVEKAGEEVKREAQELKDTRLELNKVTDQFQAKEKEATETIKLLTSSKLTVDRLEKDLLTARTSLIEYKRNSNSEITVLEGKLSAATNAFNSASKKVELAEKACEDLKVKLENELQQNDEIQREKATEIEGLKKSINEIKAELFKSEAKVQHLQVQTDEVLNEKIDMENKFKSSEERNTRLLERLMSDQSESERLQETINELRRKLEDSLSALQELGRENQSWQMENAKAQGRKWADDSIVTSCLSCSKEFTLTIRKHHCRHCGQIFCNECSSRSASVPSCKKPARVCDMCFEELTSK